MSWPADTSFDRTRVRDLGIDDAALRRAVRADEIVRVRRGRFVSAELLAPAAEESRQRLVVEAGATTAQLNDVWAALETAALLHQFSLLGRPPHRLLLTRPRAPRRTPGDLPGVRVLTAGLPPSHRTVVDDVPSTTRARTVVDIARVRPFRNAVVVADSALRRGVQQRDLDAVLADCTGWPGIRRARAVVEFADGDAESPLESVGRVMMHEQDLPRPRLQVWLGDTGRLGRVDFLFEEERTVGEADGRSKYVKPNADSRAVLWAEKQREDDLRDAGFEVVRFGWRDATRDAAATAERFRRAFARSAARRAVLL